MQRDNCIHSKVIMQRCSPMNEDDTVYANDDKDKTISGLFYPAKHPEDLLAT